MFFDIYYLGYIGKHNIEAEKYRKIEEISK